MTHWFFQKSAGKPRQHWVSPVFQKIALLFFFGSSRQSACGGLSKVNHGHA
jgi:hypothetical protein